MSDTKDKNKLSANDHHEFTSITLTDNNSGVQASRRDFMVMAATSTAAIGAACALWPLVDSMNPSAEVLALSTIEIDISNIKVGSSQTFKWRGKPIFVKRRTADEIAAAKSADHSKLPDPDSDAHRTKPGHEEWLILIGICTHLGCVPLGNQGEYSGWFCPCHGSVYDTSGRIRKGPAPKNLEVPPYVFLNEKIIKIG